MNIHEEDFEYKGVSVSVTRPRGSNGITYEELMAIVDKYAKNSQGQYLRKLNIVVDDDDQIELNPTYTSHALDRIKKTLPPPPDDIPDDIPQREIVAPWPKPKGGVQ